MQTHIDAPPGDGGPALSGVSWNIHRARGRDGRVAPDRVADALEAEVARGRTLDFLALQEADTEASPQAGLLDLERVSQATGLDWAHRDHLLRWGSESHGLHGVVVFLAPEHTIHHADLIDLPGHCARGAVAIETEVRGCAVRLVATHLSLTQVLRIAQLRTLGQYLDRRPEMPTALVGDLNEWRPWGGAALSRRVLGRRFEGPAPATFPVARPVLPLDRILATPPARVRRATALNGPRLRAASDHLPLYAEIDLPPPTD